MVSLKNALIALVVLSLLPAAVGAAVNPNLRLDNYAVGIPSIAPGDTIPLSLSIVDTENVCAEKISVQLAVSYPLSVSGPDTQYVESLCQSSPAVLNFTLYADPLATTGNYAVAVATSYENGLVKFGASNSISLRVQGQPALRMSVLSSTPLDIYAGDTVMVHLRFDNTGTGYVTSAHAVIAASGLAVKWAGKESELGQLPPRGMAAADFSVEAAKDLAPGAYPVKVAVDYVAEDGSGHTAEFPFSVPVKPKAEFLAAASQSVPIGQTSLVTISLKNTGLQDARRVKVSIRPVYPFSTDGTVRYLETLAFGQSEQLVYSIPVDRQATEGNELLTLDVAYEDPNGKTMTDTADFTLYARPQTPLEVALSYWYVVLAIIAVAAFVLNKRLKPQPKK